MMTLATFLYNKDLQEQDHITQLNVNILYLYHILYPYHCSALCVYCMTHVLGASGQFVSHLLNCSWHELITFSTIGTPLECT